MNWPDFPFSKHLIHHFWIALLLSLWLLSFLILFAPFDVSDLNKYARWTLLPPYGIIFLLNYGLLVPWQQKIYKKTQAWNLALELIFLLAFLLLCFFGSFFYYSSPIMNGDLSIGAFFTQQYIAFSLILSPLVLILRWAFGKQSARNELSKSLLVLRGSSKQDVLQIAAADLIFIQSADNYVEVNYFAHGKLEKHLLRSTLQSIRTQAPVLIQAHRSYLFNPIHFKRWKNQNIMIIAGLEVPVSKSYKINIEEHLNSTPN